MQTEKFDAALHKIFLIDYKVGKLNRSYLTYAVNRKTAEYLTRQMEKPSKIAISKVFSLDAREV